MFSNNCIMSSYLAYSMLVYVISSIYYLIITMNVGTPFKDSLNEEQIKIKEKSASVRRNIFNQGIFLGIFIVIIFKPFTNC